MGAVRGLGTRAATFEPGADDDAAFRASLTEALAERDDAVLRAYVADGPALPAPRLRRLLAEQTAALQLHPVFFGSAGTGAGVEALTAGITALLPAGTGDPEADVAGRVFKIERTASGERVALVRVFDGTLRPRQRVRVAGNGSGSHRRGRQADLDQRLRPDRRAPPRPSSPRARWPGSGASARSASATRSAGAGARTRIATRRRATSRCRRSNRSSSPAARSSPGASARP